MRTSRNRFQAATAAAVLTAVCMCCNIGARGDDSTQKPPPPIVVVIYSGTNRSSKALQSELVQLRDELRTNPRIEVLDFDPSLPTFMLAARDAGLDVDHISSDDDRAHLAQSLGAQLSVTITGGKSVDASGNPTVDATIRAVKLSGDQPAGISSTDESVLAAAQIVDEQVMVLDAAKAAARQAASGSATAFQSSAVPANGQSQTAVTGSARPTATPAPTPTAAPPLPPPAANAAPPQGAPAPVAAAAQPSSPSGVVVPAPAPGQAVIAPPSQSPPSEPITTSPPAAVAPNAPSPAPSPEAMSPAPASSATGTFVSPPAVAPALPQMPIAATAPAALAPTPLNIDTQNWIGKGDDALTHADTGAAIEDYRQAVDSSPRNAEPRIKLTQAYLAAGNPDLALGELQRAIAIEPGSDDLHNYIEGLSKSGDLPGADTLLLQLQSGSHPTDASALIALGDAYWNSSKLDLAGQSYEQAAQIPGSGAAPYARLARLYAATGRYDKALNALSHSGDAGYPAALRIIKERAETLIGDVDGDVQDFKSGNKSRTDFYSALKTDDANITDYAAFIGKITPPSAYKVSYLHRLLAANLLTQMTPDVENYALTGQSQYLDQATSLEQSAEKELKDANVADKLQQTVSAGG